MDSEPDKASPAFVLGRLNEYRTGNQTRAEEAQAVAEALEKARAEVESDPRWRDIKEQQDDGGAIAIAWTVNHTTRTVSPFVAIAPVTAGRWDRFLIGSSSQVQDVHFYRGENSAEDVRQNMRRVLSVLEKGYGKGSWDVASLRAAGTEVVEWLEKE